MRKQSVLVAVAPYSLGRIVEHLLEDEPSFRIVGRLAPGTDLARRAHLVAPDLVVANLRFLGREHVRVVQDLRRFSPAAKVLLLQTYAMPRSLGGAHAHLDEQAMVRRLLAVLRGLAGAGGPDPNPPTTESKDVETH